MYIVNSKGKIQPQQSFFIHTKIRACVLDIDMVFVRPSNRAPSALRAIDLTASASPYAEGSCLAKFGMTHVLVTASVEERVPPFLRGSGRGWITAEYGMLPRATHTRMDREASRGKQSGRTQEIQRLIGRSLRAITDLGTLGERQIRIDCDVLQADGSTRCAAITGAWVALKQAVEQLMLAGEVLSDPIHAQVAAVSCGVIDDTPLLDLDYSEDSQADTDANFVLTADGGVVEIQATAETTPFTHAHLQAMLTIASKGVEDLFAHQSQALSAPPPKAVKPPAKNTSRNPAQHVSKKS